MPTPGSSHGTRAKILIGIATALVAAYNVRQVAAVDLSRSSPAAAIAAKGTVGALGLIFCLFLYSDSGRLLRKIVGMVSLLVALLLIVAVSTGAMAWLLESMPFADILAGHPPAAIAVTFAANAYIAWVFCFSAESGHTKTNSTKDGRRLKFSEGNTVGVWFMQKGSYERERVVISRALRVIHSLTLVATESEKRWAIY